MKDSVTKLWKLKNDFILKSFGQVSYSFELKTEEDRETVLSIGSVYIASQLMLIRPWKIFAEADLQNRSTIPIWVLLRIYLWSCRGRRGLAKWGVQ